MFIEIDNAKYLGYYDYQSHTSELRMTEVFSTAFQTISHGVIYYFSSFTSLSALYIGSATAFDGTTFTKSSGFIMQATGEAQDGTCFTHDSNISAHYFNSRFSFFYGEDY